MGKKNKLPLKLIPFGNSDKDSFKETWTEKRKRDPANIIAPYRCVLIAKPGCGKTTYVQNLLIHEDPPFQKVLIVSNSPLSTEWDVVEHEKFEEIPSYDDIVEFDENNVPIKTAIVIDDMELDGLPKEQESRLKFLVKPCQQVL